MPGSEGTESYPLDPQGRSSFLFLNGIPFGKLSVQIVSYLFGNASTAVDGKRYFLRDISTKQCHFQEFFSSALSCCL